MFYKICGKPQMSNFLNIEGNYNPQYCHDTVGLRWGKQTTKIRKQLST